MSNKDEEVHATVMAALGELLNLVSGVADLQTTDAASDEIFDMCDLIAEYFQLERARAITTQHDDGTFTTHFETFVGIDTHDYSEDAPKEAIKSKASVAPITGSIRTKGKPKLRVVDNAAPLDVEPTDSDLDDIDD
jgi:hypothetical protein|tara:strand:+ start:1679 stop:2086 length:408 start_codon:yes stop_codon:yes gene_type:complete